MAEVAYVAGEYVTVNTPHGKQEGLVVGSHVDYNVRRCTFTVALFPLIVTAGSPHR